MTAQVYYNVIYDNTVYNSICIGFYLIRLLVFIVTWAMTLLSMSLYRILPHKTACVYYNLEYDISDHDYVYDITMQ